MKIGIAGTGRMGAAIAARLAGLGHGVTVWNRTAAKARSLGFEMSPALPALAASCDTVISSLSDAAAVRAVYGELLCAPVRGKLFIETSTVRPQVQREIHEWAGAQGASFVECPVGGSVGPAKEGRLFGFAGGDAADVARAMPLLREMCRRVEHVGPAGAGAAMKLAINLPLLVYWQALGEALSLCRGLDLPPERLLDIFSDTSGAPAMLKNRAGAIAAALAGIEPGAVSVDIATMAKDLREMVEEARSLGVPLPLAEQALLSFRRLSDSGFGANDCSTVPAQWLKAAGGEK